MKTKTKLQVPLEMEELKARHGATGQSPNMLATKIYQLKQEMGDRWIRNLSAARISLG